MKCKVAFVVALASSSVSLSCRTTGVADVKKMGQANDLPGLVAAYQRADGDALRIAVLEELGRHPEDPTARRIVLGEVESAENEAVKITAIRATRSFPDPEVTEPLIARLGDPWPAVREVAVEALDPRVPAAAQRLLEAAASDGNHLVRAAAVRILSRGAARDRSLQPRIEDPLIARATADDAPKVRESAVVALGDLGIARARPSLVELMRTDPDAGVRMSAERSIQKLGDRGESSAVVAVLPLKNETGLDDPEIERYGGQIAEYLAARLAAGKVCQVVDPTKLEHAINEMKKVGRAIYDGDAPNAPEIGRFKIANQLVYGSLQRQGLVFTIVVNRMEVATLRQVPGASVVVQGYRADLDRLKVKVADDLVASFR